MIGGQYTDAKQDRAVHDHVDADEYDLLLWRCIVAVLISVHSNSQLG